MIYIDNIIRNCELAKSTLPERTFTFENMDDLFNVRAAVYIIKEVGGDPQDTLEAFSQYKKTGERKCARINAPSSTLYVGSSNTSLRRRISEHLGYGHKDTYALHLRHWFSTRQMQITVREYNVSGEVLQIIEDALAFDLKPAFGKPGGNGR